MPFSMCHVDAPCGCPYVPSPHHPRLFVVTTPQDMRFSFQDWPKYKPNMPFGQAPVLEVD